MKTNRFVKTCAALVGAATMPLALPIHAADHGDAPALAADQGCDLADLYAFLDPHDNSQVVLIGTVHGFIVPGEANNFGLFDHTARFTFGIENTGDAIPDLFIDVQFSKRVKNEDGTFSQNATVTFRGDTPANLTGKGAVFTGLPVTQPSLGVSPNSQVVTVMNNLKNAGDSKMKFFAGEVDDPFFFDIPGFNRFVAKQIAHVKDPVNVPFDATDLDRGRDTFAGYNVLGIAITMPATSLLKAKLKKGESAGTKIGVNLVAGRGSEHYFLGDKIGAGPFAQVDRLGVPGVNVAFIPYNRKNAYNGATTLDDAKGVFLPDIAGTLAALGTDSGHTATLASVVGIPLMPTKKPTGPGGDFLRLETNSTLQPNAGSGGGADVAFEKQVNGGPIAHGFPNGRRLKDDVIDTVLFLVSNGGLTAGDHVDASDIAPNDNFPFLHEPQQPFAKAVTDDNTRN